MCCFNRPYDDQTQTRIRIETEAKVVIQQKIENAECQLLWSSILVLSAQKPLRRASNRHTEVA